MNTTTLDEETIKELEEDLKISKAMDERKDKLKRRQSEIPKEIQYLITELIEIDRELKEYEEEY